MAGFREPEGPEIGSPPMSSEWPTACSRNTGMFYRMKRRKPSREAACRCSGPRFPSDRSQSMATVHCRNRECRQARLNLRKARPMRYAPRPYKGFLGDAGRKSQMSATQLAKTTHGRAVEELDV